MGSKKGLTYILILRHYSIISSIVPQLRYNYKLCCCARHYCVQCYCVGHSRRDKAMKNGLDKGFCVDYYSLSYRRKFIRTLWAMAASPLLLLLPHLFPSTAQYAKLYLLIVVGIMIGGPFQAAYNYYRWKNEEREQEREQTFR